MKKLELRQLIREEIRKLHETADPLTADPFRLPAATGKLQMIKNQIEDLKPNWTINKDALKIRSLELEITYNLNNKTYKIINDETGKEYVNNIKELDDVIKFIRSKLKK